MGALSDLVFLLHADDPEGVAPLLDALEGSGARVGLVLSGEVLGALEAAPVVRDRLRALVDQGAVELLGTPLYAPVLALLPERDAVGQLLAHAGLLRRLLGVRPRGAVLPHGLWEPILPRVLGAAGLRWVAVPEAHLREAGAGLDGIHRTEREGHCVALLPIADGAAEGRGLVVRRLEGPAALAEAASEGPTVLPSQAVDLGADLGRVYLPAWGRPWEPHLVRHEVANRLHKKTLRVSLLIERLGRHLERDDRSTRPDPAHLVQARRYLYRAQAAAPYGPPGVHDPAIRERAWRDAVRAEEVALEALEAGERFVVERLDHDCDGVEDVLLRTPDTALVIHPRGAGVTELTVGSLGRNVAAVPTRRPPTGAPEVGSDAAPRALLVERFLDPEATLDAVAAGRAVDRDRGLREGLWQVVAAERHGEDGLRAVLEREGVVEAAGARHRVRVQKRFTLKDRTLGFRSELVARGGGAFRARHALELNLSLGPDLHRQQLRIGDLLHPLSEPGDRGRVEGFLLVSPEVTVEVQLLQPARLWHHPVQTVSGEAGAWRVWGQGVCVLLVHEPAVEAGSRARFDLKLRVASP